MNTRYIIIALAVVTVVVVGAVVLAGISLTAPTKQIEKVIPDERFPR